MALLGRPCLIISAGIYIYIELESIFETCIPNRMHTGKAYDTVSLVDSIVRLRGSVVIVKRRFSVHSEKRLSVHDPERLSVYSGAVSIYSVVGDELLCLPGRSRNLGNGLLIYMMAPQHLVAEP